MADDEKMETEVSEKPQDIDPETDGVSAFVSVPVELFLHICSFLSVRDMVYGLSRVCKRFNEILNDENIWKSWIQRRWASRYPIVPVDADSFNWKGACMDIESEWSMWTKESKTKPVEKVYLVCNDIHISSIDAVAFIDSSDVFISGSRDRSMIVWNHHQKTEKGLAYVKKDTAHEGWIWRLLPQDQALFSCSWDTTIKAWDINSTLEETHCFKCSSPVLSLACGTEGVVFAGEYAKAVHCYDPRRGLEPVVSYVAHNRAVLTLGSNDNTVLSGSEDKTLAVWDKRMRRVRQKLDLGRTSYPNCCSMDSNSVYIGDNKGALHVFANSAGAMEKVATYHMGHTKPISVVKHGVGFLLTASLDGFVKMCLPTNPPTVINSLQCAGEVGGLDYREGVLAVGASAAMEFWIPKAFLND